MRAVKTSLTGIKPTNTPHLGNYLGAIRPALELAKQYRSFYFIADYHALTTVREPAAMRSAVYDVAATWLASGLDPNATVLFRQSAVPEVFELAWSLSCLLATGQLERGNTRILLLKEATPTRTRSRRASPRTPGSSTTRC